MIKSRIAILLLCALLSLAGCAAYRDVPHDVGKNAYPVEAYRTTMQYYDDFKILQIADLHLGIETDVAYQLGIVKDTIRREQPDLIILTGDTFRYASKGVVKSLISTLNEECARLSAERDGRLTKFTLTFGNHDNQGDYPRYYINEVIASYVTTDGNEIRDSKFAAFVDYEDDNLFGLTNFYIDIVADRASSRDTADVKYRVHIIDSNTYHFMGPDYDYDVMHDEQLTHAQSIYREATADKDYIGMAFFHIPLYEYQDAYDQFLASDHSAANGQGEYREDVLYGYENNNSYQMLRAANIAAYFCGHDHINYGDIIFNASSQEVADRAIFCYGVKSTNQLYHDTDIIGYKTVTLRDVTLDEFVSMDYVSANFKNYTGGYSNYEND
ncbi:MAG: metallophosphoesterase [Clostridia bacterium]|nr:metallophosphoesterase [Clostridia bacterium]